MALNEPSFLVSYTFNALIDGAKLPFSLEKVLQNVSKNKPVLENALKKS